MNNIIKRELNKITEVNIQFDDNTTSIKIPKKGVMRVEEDHMYIIKLSDYMINPPMDSALVTNWNNNTYPTFRYYKVDVQKIMSDMVKITGMAYDYDTKCDIDNMWIGWIPNSEFEILEKL